MAEGYRFENVDLSCLTSSTFSIVSVSFYVLVSTVTIFGNLLIILSIYKYPSQFKGSLYMFIWNLAAADLLLGAWLLVFIFEEIVPDVKQFWYYCAVKPIGIFISYGCSNLILLGISFDRFMAVLFPLKHLIKTNKRHMFIGLLTGIWMIAILNGSLPVILKNLQPPNSTFVCRIGAIIPRDMEFIAAVLIIMVIVINFILYGMVIWKIKTNISPGNSTSRKKNTKTVLMIIVFVLFVVCWLPFVICSIMIKVDISPSNLQNIMCVKEYVANLGYINSSLNWILYGLANQKFRKAFKRILCCKCCTHFSQTFSILSDENRIRQSCNNLESSVDSKVLPK